MIQQFIELGQGYGDVYELCELIKTNEKRFHNAFIFISTKEDKKVASIAATFKAAGEGKFMPIYICREGIPYNSEKPSQRIAIFEETLSEIGRKAIPMEVKHSSIYSETVLYYQHLIGILRMNHFIPPKQ
ncbi:MULTISPECIES: methylthioribose kinase [Lysinibacillus]|uniref:Methylthioribose kinase n=1 Tax=Lysinibacillus antri TaxID=2498145 RepID=A0A3S0R861_9BACI|nr:MULTISPECIES: methylthioribose kinase [Lysinibacillus]RUL55927.1 methylthioribose kinase [Lysinibacillus antri]TSI09328.1 methylthioribose kinase [Lysinibacillus sp. BW-2-10]